MGRINWNKVKIIAGACIAILLIILSIIPAIIIDLFKEFKDAYKWIKEIIISAKELIDADSSDL